MVQLSGSTLLLLLRGSKIVALFLFQFAFFLSGLHFFQFISSTKSMCVPLVDL